MGLTKKNMHFCLEHSFSGDPVFPDWKVSAKLKVVPGGCKKTQKWCLIHLLFNRNFQKQFVNHIGVLFFPVWVYVTMGDKSFIYVAVGVYR